MSQLFTGNIFIFHAFDVGDDIDLEQIKAGHLLSRRVIAQPKYFKNYHIPLGVELPQGQQSPRCESARLHNFGVISLRYKVPFKFTLDELRGQINSIEDSFHDQSVSDAGSIFKRIKSAIKKPRFFHLRKSFVVIQVNPEESIKDPIMLKEMYGSNIASILRFETETLSEVQKNEIMEIAIGYYRGDLIIVDTDAAFIYDDEYDDILDLFEFANIQQLELHYFDRVLDQRLNMVYEREINMMPLMMYVPLWGTLMSDPIGDLGKLRVDISVIIERLENSVKLSGEPYYSEIYSLLVDKLDLKRWKESIDTKLAIVSDVSSFYHNKADMVRQDLFSLLIIILIFLEFVVGILHYFK
jgi:hypothetical protein